MSKLYGVLSFAGDKAAARSLASDEVSAAVIRAVTHNDRAHFVDTLRALPRGSIASAIAETFPLIEAHCLYLHADGTAAPVGAEASPMAVEFAAHVHRIATEYAAPLAEVRAAEPKARKAMESTLAEMGKETARVWLGAVDSLCEAASAARKAKADERKAAKAAEAEAAEAAKAEAERVRLAGVQGQAIGADGQAIGTNVSAMVEEVNAAKAAAEAAPKASRKGRKVAEAA